MTDAATLQSFRNDNVIKQRVVEGTLPSRPPLPSDFDPTFRYGLHSKHRTAEVARYNGPIEPPIKHLIQGAYTHEFVHMNARRGMTSTNAADYVRKPIKPATTRAAEGHKYGATKKYLLPEIAASTSPGGGDDGMWKMTKFKKVGPVVTQYMGGVTSPGGSAAPIEAS